MRCAYLASPCKALQPGDLEEGDDWEHDGCQSIDWQPVLLQNNHRQESDALGITTLLLKIQP